MKFTKGQTSGENNVNWKGDDVGYFALHDWVSRQLGKATVCFVCNSSKNVQWANKSHLYKRDLTDWIQLCVKCHKKYDSKGRGVTFHKAANKWQSQLVFDGKNHYLGLYKTLDEAIKVANKAKEDFERNLFL